MKDNLQLKARYFANYLGQNIQYNFITREFQDETRYAILNGLDITVNNLITIPVDRNGVLMYYLRDRSIHVDKCELLLRPISSLTDEEAIRVAKIYADTITENYSKEQLIKEGKRLVKIMFGYKDSKWNMLNIYACYEYLKSLSVAVPCFDPTTNQLIPIGTLIEWGWIKLI
jgi:hypothetical protein